MEKTTLEHRLLALADEVEDGMCGLLYGLRFAACLALEDAADHNPTAAEWLRTRAKKVKNDRSDGTREGCS